MDAQFLAIDGSTISVSAETELGKRVTCTGWAVVPSLMRAQPFSIYPAGHSRTMEETVRADFPEVEILSEAEFSVKGGTLRTAQATVPRTIGGHRTLTIGAWEGRRGCLTTSMVGEHRESLVEIFDSLQFKESARGLSIDSPVLPRPRPPELLQEIPELGVMAIRPAVASELERIPRAEGRKTRHGEVFRARSDSNSLLFLGKASVTRLQPRSDASLDRLAEVVEGLSIQWTPRATPRQPR